MTPRPARFVGVGVVGFAVQVTALWILTRGGIPWLPATVLAVESAIVVNYLLHRNWTWAGRRGSFWKFNASTAVTSVIGNVALMAVLLDATRLSVVAANVIAVAVMSVVNFAIGDQWVFRLAILALCLSADAANAQPGANTAAAWDRYVAETETRISRQPVAAVDGAARAEGDTVDIGDATVSDWHGSVFVPHVTLDALLHRLQFPGTPPPQEDVAASRVLARGPDSLRVYIRLVRRAIVTVTYDTEHEMTFARRSPTVATARSVATRIQEVGGGDKGFLWRLNSYWQYVETHEGVSVSLRSLTLSRDVPVLIKPLAARVIPRIARESVVRTLEALRRWATAKTETE